VLVGNVFGHDEHVMTAWRRDGHVELVGNSASVVVPSGQSVLVLSAADERPLPPGEQPPTNQPSEMSMVEEPIVPRNAA
jgi:hypothetical protein